MKSLLLATALAVAALTSTTVLAQSGDNQPTLPEKCPSLAAIAAEGLDHLSLNEFFSTYSWVGVKEKSNYDTKESWTLFYYGHHSLNPKRAMAEMVEALDEFATDYPRYIAEPIWSYGLKTPLDTPAVECVYHIRGETILAITPSVPSFTAK